MEREAAAAQPLQGPGSSSLEIGWSRMSDAIAGVFCNILSRPIRRLCEELQAGASAYGYLDQGRAVTPLGPIGGRPNPGSGGSARELSGEVHGSTMLSAQYSCNGLSAGLPAEIRALPSVTASWICDLAATPVACSAGIASLSAGGVAALFIRCNVLQPFIVIPAAATVAISACCMVTWALLELTVHDSYRRLCQLLTGLQLQHKLAREAVRWVQELDITLKALSGAHADTRLATGVASPGSNSTVQAGEGFHEEPQGLIHICGPPYCGTPLCYSTVGGAEPQLVRRQSDGTRLKDLSTWPLRLRLYQVLEWQERSYSCIYEDIIRPTEASHLAWRRYISQGPWMPEKGTEGGSGELDRSLRTLKDITAKSWILHSRLWTGFQIAFRQLLFSLNAQLQRSRADIKRRSNTDQRTGAFSAAASGWKPMRQTSRIWRQILQAPEPQGSAFIAIPSLGEEVEGAKVLRCDASPPLPTNMSISARRQAGSCVGFSKTDVRKRQAPRRPSSSSPAAPGGSPENTGQELWIWDISKAAASGVLGGVGLLLTSANGIAASWSILRQLYRLRCAMSAAALVAAETSKALRMLVEEDWASCPVVMPQPRCGYGMDMPKKGTPQLVPCAALPPVSAFRPLSYLSGAAAPMRRTALSSMSRNIAASLAILRLPLTTSCCLGMCQIGHLCFSGGGCASCLSCPMVRRSGSTAGLLSVDSQCPSAALKEDRDTGDPALHAFVQLILRHLRMALEEGERLEQSLRPSSSTTEVSVPPEAPVEVSKTNEEVEIVEKSPQQQPAEPVRYLEVYTGIGQDSVNNKLRFQEEAELLEAFADDDPVVRERSQVILRELEFILKSRERERQSFPRVLKDFSVSASEVADDVAYREESSGALVRVVVQEREAARNSSHTYAWKEDSGIGDGDEKASLLANGSGEDEDVIADQVVDSSLSRVNSITLEAVSLPEEQCVGEDAEWLIEEHEAFRIRQRKLRGCAVKEDVGQSPETLASHSLMLQLQKVLRGQQGGSRGSRGILRSSGNEVESGVAVGGPQLGSEPEAKQEVTRTFGDEIAEDEEWDVCDVAEGPGCVSEAPIWVTSPLERGDSNLSATEEPQEEAGRS